MNMKICLVGSILRHQIILPNSESYTGWGGIVESAIAPFACLLDSDSEIFVVSNVGKDDASELKQFWAENYPIVNSSGVGVNPEGTDFHIGTKDSVCVKLRVTPTRYMQIEPFIHNVDVVLFNFGNIDDIDPKAIQLTKKNSHAFFYVDVHRKPFGVDKDGYIYSRGWPGWEEFLCYADAVQMNRFECQALFQRKMDTLDDFVQAAIEIFMIGTPMVIITLGSSGTLFVNDRDRYMLIPIFPGKVVDTTGCGDAFAAGFLVGLFEGKHSAEAVKLGNATATVNCEFIGYMKDIDRKGIELRML